MECEVKPDGFHRKGGPTGKRKLYYVAWAEEEATKGLYLCRLSGQYFNE